MLEIRSATPQVPTWTRVWQHPPTVQSTEVGLAPLALLEPAQWLHIAVVTIWLVTHLRESQVRTKPGAFPSSLVPCLGAQLILLRLTRVLPSPHAGYSPLKPSRLIHSTGSPALLSPVSCHLRSASLDSKLIDGGKYQLCVQKNPYLTRDTNPSQLLHG